MLVTTAVELDETVYLFFLPQLEAGQVESGTVKSDLR